MSLYLGPEVNMGFRTSIGSSGKCQVEFYPASPLSSDDEAFIRSHIVVKSNSSSGRI